MTKNLQKVALITGITGQDGSYLAEQVARIVGYKGSIEWDTSKPDGYTQKTTECESTLQLGLDTKNLTGTGITLGHRRLPTATLNRSVT